MSELSKSWRKHGHRIRRPSRLRCGGYRHEHGSAPVRRGQGRQILTNRKTLTDFETLVEAEVIGELSMKGFAKPVAAFSIVALKHTD